MQEYEFWGLPKQEFWQWLPDTRWKTCFEWRLRTGVLVSVEQGAGSQQFELALEVPKDASMWYQFGLPVSQKM